MEILNNFINVDDLSTFVTSWSLLVFVFLLVFLIFRYRTQIVGFLKTTRTELSKVEWLSAKETRRYTIINIVFIVAMTLLVFLLDQGFLFLRNLLI